MQLPRVRRYLTLLVFLVVVGQLLYEHLDGGIVSHHLLARADLPSVSNAWGLVLLPALAWFAFSRAMRRARRPGRLPKDAAYGFIAALLYGGAIAAAFTLGHDAATRALFYGAFGLALLLPLYRAEYLLGFVIGMMAAVGAVLPFLAGLLVTTLSATARLLLWPLLRRMVGRH